MLDETDPRAGAAAAICAAHDNDPSDLIEILHDIQDRYGLIDPVCLPAIATALNLSRAEVHGVLSFYHDFRQKPAGRVTIRICRAEACQSMGALALIDRIRARYAVELGETSAAGLTLEPVYCLGNCALSPAAMINGRLYGRLDDEGIDALLEQALA